MPKKSSIGTLDDNAQDEELLVSSSEDNSFSSEDPSSSYDDSSESSEDSSSSSSSSSGDIYFDEHFSELTNADAGDWEDRVITYTNNTGRTVASVEIGGSSLRQNEPFTATKGSGNSVNFKSTTEIGPEGMHSITRSITFKDVNGDTIGTDSITFDIMKTLKWDIEDKNGSMDYSASLATPIKTTFETSIPSGFTDPNAGVNAGLAAEAAISGTGFNSSIKAGITGAIPNISQPDNISLSLNVSGSFSTTINSSSVTDLVLSGSWELTLSSNSTTNGTLKSAGTVTFDNVNTGSKVADFILEGTSIGVVSTTNLGGGGSFDTTIDFVIGLSFQW